MKLKILAAALCAAALPVLAQSGSAPAEPRQAKVEVSNPASGTPTAAPKKASKSSKAHKSTHTAKKSTKKKAKKKPQATG